MSKAKPMDPERRIALYTAGRRNMTPRQRCRWTRKAHRYDGYVWPVTGKGEPTPRRPRRGPVTEAVS